MKYSSFWGYMLIILEFLCIKFKKDLFILKRVSGGGAEKEGERESQADFLLIQGLISQSKIMTWAETTSQTLNPLSHLSSPRILFLVKQ